MGDMNINFLDTRNPNTKALKSLMQTYGLQQVVKEPTRYSKNNNPTLIDLIFTNCDKIADKGTKNLNLSDHELVFVTKKKLKNTKCEQVHGKVNQSTKISKYLFIAIYCAIIE